MKQSIDKSKIWTGEKYFQYRYKNGSYKHQKIAVQSKLITVQCGKEKLALYGTPDVAVKPIQITALKGRLSYWKQIERERSRALKLATKKRKRTTDSLVTES